MTALSVVAVAWAPVADATDLLTRVVTDLLGRHPGPLHHACPRCGSLAHGRPSFDASVEVSVAHAPGLTLVAASTAGPVGVDLERHGTVDRDWLYEEAIAKAQGTGLTDRRQDRSGAHFFDVDVPGHLAAVAVLAAERPELRTLPAGPEAPGLPATP